MATIIRFRVVAGKHYEPYVGKGGGRFYKVGNIVESVRDLDKLFPNKFERLEQGTGRVVVPMKEEPNAKPATPVVQPKPAPQPVPAAESKPATVTAPVTESKPADVQVPAGTKLRAVPRKEGGFDVLNTESGKKLNTVPLTKEQVGELVAKGAAEEAKPSDAPTSNEKAPDAAASTRTRTRTRKPRKSKKEEMPAEETK